MTTLSKLVDDGDYDELLVIRAHIDERIFLMGKGKFSTGKIYRIVQIDRFFLVYVGSTINPLDVRFSGHRCFIVTNPFSKLAQYVMSHGGSSNFRIELIMNFACRTRQELEQKEGYFVYNMKPACNIRIPGGIDRFLTKTDRIPTNQTVSQYLTRQLTGAEVEADETHLLKMYLCLMFLCPDFILTLVDGRCRQKMQRQLVILGQVLRAIGWSSPFDTKRVPVTEVFPAIMQTELFTDYNTSMSLFNRRATPAKQKWEKQDLTKPLQAVLKTVGIRLEAPLVQRHKTKGEKEIRNREYVIQRQGAIELARRVTDAISAGGIQVSVEVESLLSRACDL